MGARPMARVIQDYIKRPLAEDLLFGKLIDGGHVRVTIGEDGDSLLLLTRAAKEPELIKQQ
jgi:ATP-dependent Clp protease ATP-binding subunit ClpA